MEYKLLKLYFTDKDKWLSVKPTFYVKDQQLIDGVLALVELGHLQKPPDEGWEPVDEEDNGWYTSQWFSVDLLVEDSFDYSQWQSYVLGVPKDTNRFLHKMAGVWFEPIIDTGRLSANTKAELQLICRTWGIGYNAGDTKAQLIQKIEDNIDKIIGNGI